jgi:CheY-like chemotaxis protein
MPRGVVLCVDDDLDGLIGREELLKLHGYRVLISTSPEQAVRLLKAQPVDGVILDYQMPEMSGDAVAHRMKQVRPGVPIMMLSAQERLPAEALEEVDAFVSKAQAPLEFVAAVHELVATDPPFFARWLQDWKQGSRAA